MDYGDIKSEYSHQAGDTGMPRIPINSTLTVRVPLQVSPCRIDQFVTSQFSSYSRSFFKRLITYGHVTLNTIPVTKAGTIITAGDIIIITLPHQAPISDQNIKDYSPDIALIYQHEHFLIVYKPAGLTTHKPHALSTEITLVAWLLINYKDLAHTGAIDRPGIVHRLDKNTSGLIIIARTQYGHKLFTTMFKERTIKKTYLALVRGHTPKNGTIDLAITRHPTIKTKMTAVPLSPQAIHNAITNTYHNKKIRAALTHYEAIRYFDNYSLLSVTPITGRTHQIRVHLAAIGYPILGDTVYGEPSALINRHALHAYQLSFSFDGIPYSFSHPIATDMDLIIQQS